MHVGGDGGGSSARPPALRPWAFRRARHRAAAAQLRPWLAAPPGLEELGEATSEPGPGAAPLQRGMRWQLCQCWFGPRSPGPWGAVGWRRCRSRGDPGPHPPTRGAPLAPGPGRMRGGGAGGACFASLYIPPVCGRCCNKHALARTDRGGRRRPCCEDSGFNTRTNSEEVPPGRSCSSVAKAQSVLATSSSEANSLAFSTFEIYPNLFSIEFYKFWPEQEF